jgi:hypothetical protein
MLSNTFAHVSELVTSTDEVIHSSHLRSPAHCIHAPVRDHARGRLRWTNDIQRDSVFVDSNNAPLFAVAIVDSRRPVWPLILRKISLRLVSLRVVGHWCDVRGDDLCLACSIIDQQRTPEVSTLKLRCTRR